MTPATEPHRIGTEGGAPPPKGVSTRVAFRDLVLFQLKLFLDGVGDLVLAPVAAIAFGIDLLRREQNNRAFYAVLRVGERWDRWLSLYKPAGEGKGGDEGLLEAGLVDANTFLGKVEELIVDKGLRKGPADESNPAPAPPPEDHPAVSDDATPGAGADPG